MSRNHEEKSAHADTEIDIAETLGASEETSLQRLSLYIPNKDREGAELAAQRKWVMQAATLLARIGGGVTIMPPEEGGWMNEKGEIIWEQPIVVYSYIKPDEFLATLPELREFLHRMGRETNQGEVAVEFDGQFFRITGFDPEGGS